AFPDKRGGIAVWSKLVEFVTRLFSSKGGATQIGSANSSSSSSQSISGVTVGDGVRNVIVTNTNNIYSSTPPQKTTSFEPTPEETAILAALAQPGASPLLRARLDCQSQYVLLINGKEAAHPYNDVDGCYRYLDALRRLQENNLLVDDSGDGQAFRLSPAGRIAAKQLEAPKG